MNSRQVIKHFRRRVPGVSEEVKELLSTDGLVWLFLGHCRGAVQTPPPLQTPPTQGPCSFLGSLLPGQCCSLLPTNYKDGMAYLPHPIPA